MGIQGKENTIEDCIMTIQSKRHKYCQSRHAWLMLNFNMNEDFQLQGVGKSSWISRKEGMS